MVDEPFSLEVAAGAPPDVVWHALRDRDEVLQWHGWGDGVATVGATPRDDHRPGGGAHAVLSA